MFEIGLTQEQFALAVAAPAPGQDNPSDEVLPVARPAAVVPVADTVATLRRARRGTTN